MKEQKVFICAMARTPLGCPGGALARFDTADLSAAAIKKLLEKQALAPESIGQTVFGQAMPSTMPNNIGHYGWLKAELPPEVPGYTIQANGLSGLMALRSAFMLAAGGDEDLVLAGAAESYSAAPFVMRNVRLHFDPADRRVIDTLEEAECGTQPEALSRLDAYRALYGEAESLPEAAYREASRSRGVAEAEKQPELAALHYKDRKKGEITVDRDEWPGRAAQGPLAPYADGAAVCLVAGEKGLAEAGGAPLAEITGFAVAGGDPKEPWEVGAEAARKLMWQLSLKKEDFAAFEILENSGADVLKVAAALGLPEEKINGRGGALCVGLPGSAEGFLMLERLISTLQAGEKGLLAAYASGGLGVAVTIQKC